MAIDKDTLLDLLSEVEAHMSSLIRISSPADSSLPIDTSSEFWQDRLIPQCVNKILESLCGFSAEDAKLIIGQLKPKTTLLTHFGMWMIKAKPWLVAERLTAELGRQVVAAADGWAFKFD